MNTLREIREAKIISQEDLAKISGVAGATISRIENGHRKPRYVTMRKLAKALNVPPEKIEWRS